MGLAERRAIKAFQDYEAMLADPDIHAVDICAPTLAHRDLAVAALRAGKHVICEKPLARTSAQARDMAAVASETGRIFMPAMCLRFLPEWVWVRAAIVDGRFGRVLSARFRRVAEPPGWGQGNFLDGAKSGGALLDLHIHDADFIMSVLGMPPAVFSRAGHVCPDGPKVDHVITHYLYDDAVVVAEGGWGMPAAYPFEMAFEALGEKGCLRFSTSDDPTLSFIAMDGEPCTPHCVQTTGYYQELVYFTDCIANDKEPERVMPFEAREAVRLVMAEKASIASGCAVDL